MKNKKMVVSALTLATTIGLGALGSVSAYQGDYTKKGPDYTLERHALMTKAFQNNDYDTWKSLMVNNGRVMQVINKDNFSKFAEAHKLALEGKYDEANSIRMELGLRGNNGKKVGVGFGRGQGLGIHRIK